MKLAQILQVEKVNQTTFDSIIKQLQAHQDKGDQQQDQFTVQIKNITHFIDRYIPISVSQLINEFLRVVLVEKQLQKLDNFQIVFTKKLND